ncbi:hypothetical protein Ocin01_11555 [Orchesella cincta]|uniref:Uncharacterized protein n=1 Tax=Orchesella cincta TaxID=48709 RepID=A0A1D2MQ06_ORCCI|nr:hypothetical protein Ocin01_11555 [Orchesella cincta]
MKLKQTLFSIEFHNVPKDMIANLPMFLQRCIENHLMRDVMDQDNEGFRRPSYFDDEDMGFDYQRMIEVVHHFYQDELAGMENFVQDKICQAVIPDWIYSKEDSDLMFDRRINSAYTIHHFLSQPPEFWKMVMKTCFLDQSWSTVGAIPSKQLYDRLEEERLQKVQHRLKPENIKETKRAAQKYKAAKKYLERPHPPELLDKFRLPSMESIGFIKILRQDNPDWAKDTLCNLYVDDINSNNVFITIIMDTSELTLDEKKYLVLFAEGILSSPYFDNSDKLHTAEECEMELKNDVLTCETFFGLEWLGNLEDRTRFSCGSYPHLFCLRLKLDVEKTKEGFQWAQLLLWNTKWQADKMKNVAVRLVRDVEFELKKHGPVMTRAMLVDSLYLMNSTPKSVSLIRQKMFLRRIAEDLPKSMRKVTKMLESIRMTILRPENVTVHVAASLAKMEFHLTEAPHARDAVSQLFRSTFDYTGWHWGYDTKRLSNTPDMHWMRSSDCIGKCSREQILRMDNTTVGYLIQAAPGIRSWSDWEYPYLLIALQYFIQKDGGPLYKEIVETGFAKEVDIRVSPTEGVIYFEMRECTDLVQAYGKAFDIMLQHLSPAAAGAEEPFQWDLYLLRSAVSTMILRLTQEENTPTHVAMHSLLAYYKGKQLKDTRELMGTIARASVEQVQTTAKKYFQPLFLQPCTCAASAPAENAIQIIKDLMERCGKRLELIPPVEQSALASYNQ